MNKKGFSLVEVIIVITIIGIIGVITSTILSRSYQAGSSSTKISKLRQNGDVALGEIADAIRSAEAVVCYGSAPSNPQIALRTSLGKFIKYKIVEPVISSSGKVVENGYIAKQEGLDPTQESSFCSDSLITPAITKITDDSENTGVNISGGAFTKLTNTVSKDTVLVKFNVTDSMTVVPTEAVSSVELVKMETTAQVR